MKRLILLLACVAAVSARAQPPEALPAYEPQVQVAGTLTTWGHVFVKDVMTRWEAGFAKYHPGVRFDDKLVSSAAAMGALFTKTADIGFIGREVRPMEMAGYARVMKGRPLAFEVMTGCFTNPDKSPALGVFVHKDNPLSRLSFAQLDAIFGAELKGGAPVKLRTWGQLGLTGEWADKPIHIYQGLLDAAPAFYFSTRVMGSSLLWNENTTLFDDIDRPGATLTAAQQIVEALGKDPYGIALAGAGTPNPSIKLLAVAEKDSGAYLLPTPQSVQDRTYPLTRSVWLFVNPVPPAQMRPLLKEFLRYIYSREGQADVAAAGDYFPLTPALAAKQRAKLD